MAEVVMYTRSGTRSPSSNYRLLQYAPRLSCKVECRPMSSDYTYYKHANARNRLEKLFWYSLYYGEIQCRLFYYMCKDLADKPRCIVISRANSPKIILGINKLLMKCVYKRTEKLIWDFDDEIFVSKEITNYEARLLNKFATTIVVTNDYLRNRLPVESKAKTILLPTTDNEFVVDNDLERIEKKKEVYDYQIELLWLATSTSLKFLYKIGPVLEETAKQLEEVYGKKMILHVVCNKPFEFQTNHLVIDNVTWTREVAKQMVQRSHIGIMPLDDTVSTNGKGGFKIVQYMSAAMPSISSAVGFNREVIINEKTGLLIEDTENQDGWTNAIITLAINWDKYQRFCLQAKEEWKSNFSYEENLQKWNELIL